MKFEEMKQRIVRGDGFIAALDQSGGSTPKALRGYGIDDGVWGSEEEMFDLIHAMRCRIITSPAFSGEKVIGAILFERTMDGQAQGKPVPQLLHGRGVVPFLKIDRGLEQEDDGVQLMKPIPGLDPLLARAKNLGIFGTKERSVINLASRDGIRAIVVQQFAVARQVLDAGLVPIIEPEVNIASPERAEADRILRDELLGALPAIVADEQVMLKLSIPAEPNLFLPLVEHPRVLRVVALSGGYTRPQACAELARNDGMIASFSRALLEDLRAQMNDEEFDKALAAAIEEISCASTSKLANAA